MKKICNLFLAMLVIMTGIVAYGKNVVSNSAKFGVKGIRNITAITESFGTGQKLTGVVVEYEKEIDNSKLTQDTFSVVERNVTKVYANTENDKAKTGKNGRFVVIELNPDDEKAQLFIKADNILDAKVEMKQEKDVFATNGKAFKKNLKTLVNNNVKNLVVDNFKQFEYKDSKTGTVVKYNLYIPKNYDKNKKYPMIMFIHDAGPLSENTKVTLLQGNGATVWATPEEQAKHEAFVLAPQYSQQVVDDNGNYTADLEATVNLIRDYLVKEYSIDTDRLYTTGQSMGGMMSIVMNFKYPDLFAASYFVACQWDANLTAPMAKNKMWTVVSTGDTKAFPGWNAIIQVLTKNGGIVVKDVWRGDYTTEQFQKGVTKVLNENPNANIKYTTLEKGTLPALQPGNPGSEHMTTWKTAYNIEGIRDWVFEQRKK